MKNSVEDRFEAIESTIRNGFQSIEDRFSAIESRIDEGFSRAHNQFSSIEAMLLKLNDNVTVEERISALESKICDGLSKTNDRFSAMESRIDDGFSKVHQNFTSIEAMLLKLTQKQMKDDDRVSPDPSSSAKSGNRKRKTNGDDMIATTSTVFSKKVKTESEKMKIYVNSATGYFKYTLDFESTDTIKKVKAKIQEIEKNPSYKYGMMFGDVRLEEEKTLADYNIENKSTIKCVLCKRSDTSYMIFVTTLDHSRIVLEVEKTDTIDEVKAMIERMVKIPPDQQRLMFYCRLLDDGAKTLEKCSIQTESTLHLSRHE